MSLSVGDGCHAVPQATIGRDDCTNEVGKLLVGKGSDSYFVYFASLRSECLNPVPAPRSLLPVSCSLVAAATPSRLHLWKTEVMMLGTTIKRFLR